MDGLSQEGATVWERPSVSISRVRPRHQSDCPRRVYSEPMNTFWTSRISQATAKYGEAAPTATVCCNACRTCVQTNLISLALAGAIGMGAGVARIAQRLSKHS